MYGKVFTSIYQGTLYGQWEALVTFIQMIVLCDADGMIDMTPHAISARTSIPLDIIMKGIGVLEAPDPYSRTPDQEGRRIERIDAHRPWGWHIVNHDMYMRLQDADMVRAQTKERVRKHRLAKESVTVTDGNGSKRYTDIDIDTNKNKEESKVAALPDWLPKEAWSAWLEVRAKNRAPNTPRALGLAIKALERFKSEGGDVIAILEQSTLRGWRGLFPVKDGKPDYSAVQRQIEEEERGGR